MKYYNQEYVDKFKALGKEKLKYLGFSIAVEVLNGSGGARLTRLLLSHRSSANFYVQYQDNRLDYTYGVLVFACKSGQYEPNKSLLPKTGDFYNYFGPDLDADIKSLIEDFCKLPSIKSLA